MSFTSEASNLLTNKYFLYFIVFLAVSNVLGYIVTNKYNAVGFFILICLLMVNFSKNMVIVLIVAIVSTNLLMVNKTMREGLTNNDDTTTSDATTASDTDAVKDQAVKNAVKQQLRAKMTGFEDSDATTTTDATTTDATTTPTTTTPTTTTPTTTTTPVVDEGFAPAGVGASGKKRGAIGGPAKPSRIDYATTLEDAYDNLDKILGSGGMKNLSADTEKLMNQQKTLFEAMNTMLPLVTNAQSMLKSLDMGKITQMMDMTKSFGSPK